MWIEKQISLDRPTKVFTAGSRGLILCLRLAEDILVSEDFIKIDIWNIVCLLSHILKNSFTNIVVGRTLGQNMTKALGQLFPTVITICTEATNWGATGLFGALLISEVVTTEHLQMRTTLHNFVGGKQVIEQRVVFSSESCGINV